MDKTPFIEQIEESNKYFFFIRPRRFGKTLTLSPMLENYYDINKKDKFDEIFGRLYIGQNPTPEHNTYLIIHLNFAEVAAGFDNYIRMDWTTIVALYSISFVTSMHIFFLPIPRKKWKS